jgi:hypothetical protein
MIKKAEAREQIRNLWRRRPSRLRSPQHKMLFYQELKKEYPDLLKFRDGRSKPDKYQTISGFVNDLTMAGRSG